MEAKNKIPKRVWRGKQPKAVHVSSTCVHCGKPLQQWEYLQNRFYHAACILQIKRSGL